MSNIDSGGLSVDRIEELLATSDGSIQVLDFDNMLTSTASWTLGLRSK